MWRTARRCSFGLRRRRLSQRADPRVARSRPEGPDAGRQLGHAPLLAYARADRGRAGAQGRVHGRARPRQGALAFERLWMEGKIELECVPQGTFAERIRAGGAGIPAFYTPVGFGTELAQGKEVRSFGGRDYVLEQAIKGDLALVRADTADRYGNLAFRYAQMNSAPSWRPPRSSRWPRCAPCSMSRCRTSACSCRASMSTACRGRSHAAAQPPADRLARRPGHRRRHAGQSGHRHAGAVATICAPRSTSSSSRRTA